MPQPRDSESPDDGLMHPSFEREGMRPWG